MGAEIGISTDKIGARRSDGIGGIDFLQMVGIGNGQIRIDRFADSFHS